MKNLYVVCVVGLVLGLASTAQAANEVLISGTVQTGGKNLTPRLA